MNDEVCKEKHKAIDEKLVIHTTQIEEHYDRIRSLELADVKRGEQVDNVCEKVGGLTTAIWWFVGSLLLGGGGFIIWYIQN